MLRYMGGIRRIQIAEIEAQMIFFAGLQCVVVALSPLIGGTVLAPVVGSSAGVLPSYSHSSGL